MTVRMQLRLYDNDWPVYSGEFIGPVELGRQQEGEAGPGSRTERDGCCRLVIARRDEQTVSRMHALLQPQAYGTVCMENLSHTRVIRMPDGDLKPGAACDLALPAVLTLGGKVVRVQEPDAGEPHMQTLAEATVPPGSRPEGAPRFPTFTENDSEQGKTFVRWLQAVMGVLQSAASSADFFDKAAQAVVDIVGLDSGRVLLLEGEEWRGKAHHAVAGAELSDGPPSQHVLNTVGREKRTFWELSAFDTCASGGASLAGVTAVVAAPILGSCGNVIGAIYGDRRQSGPSCGSPSISEVEAMLVELLACGVAAGLARLEQERAALSAQVQFEQFFTPELSRQLAAEPDLLRGRDADITVLFCDIRGFSRISERLGPTKTVAWISDVMNTLSTCVRGHSGVLVDYIGDELVAMWGAPEQQPDHACLACSAALAILGTLPELIDRWQPVIGVPMAVGIGINSGIARVGNTGSRYKFKYGPLGNTVNLGSRVEGSTKYLRTRLLITGATRAQLDARFATRRLCRVRVVNIAEPVDLYELAPPDDCRWTDLRDRYEQALVAFERRDFRDAVQIVGNLLHEYPDDGPSLILLSRSTTSLIEDSPHFDPVWELSGK